MKLNAQLFAITATGERDPFDENEDMRSTYLFTCADMARDCDSLSNDVEVALINL